MLLFLFQHGGPLTFWLRNKVFKLSQEQTQIIDSLLVYMQNKVDLINIETEKIEYYYLHPFSRFPYYSQIIVSYLCQLFLSLMRSREHYPLFLLFRMRSRFVMRSIF